MPQPKIHIFNPAPAHMNNDCRRTEPSQTIERWAFDIGQQGPGHVKIMFMDANQRECRSMIVASALPADEIRRRLNVTGEIAIDRTFVSGDVGYRMRG